MTDQIRRATARDATVLSMLNADAQVIHAAALPWWFAAGAGPARAAASA
jgi:hypothetical protein